MRQISQLANAASEDSFRTHEKCCLLLHLLFEPAVEQPSQLNSRPCNQHICMSLHMHECKSLLVIWTWRRRRRRRQCEKCRQRSFIYVCAFLNTVLLLQLPSNYMHTCCWRKFCKTFAEKYVRCIPKFCMSSAHQNFVCQVHTKILYVRCIPKFCMSGAYQNFVCQVHTKILYVRCIPKFCMSRACQVHTKILYVKCIPKFCMSGAYQNFVCHVHVRCIPKFCMSSAYQNFVCQVHTKIL